MRREGASDGGTVFFATSEPAIAIVGMMTK